jgi:hypothetical protein
MAYRLKHRRGTNARMSRRLARHRPTFEELFPEQAARLHELRLDAERAVMEITGGQTFPPPSNFRALSPDEAAAWQTQHRSKPEPTDVKPSARQRLREAVIADRGLASWEHGERLIDHYTGVTRRWARYYGATEWEAVQFSLKWETWICEQFLRDLAEEQAA